MQEKFTTRLLEKDSSCEGRKQSVEFGIHFFHYLMRNFVPPAPTSIVFASILSLISSSIKKKFSFLLSSFTRNNRCLFAVKKWNLNRSFSCRLCVSKESEKAIQQSMLQQNVDEVVRVQLKLRSGSWNFWNSATTRSVEAPLIPLLHFPQQFHHDTL